MSRTYQEAIPKHENVSKFPEYWKLVEWCATPSPLRKPATLIELAKTLSVHNTTLSRWQAMPEFYGDARARIKKELRGELPDILYSLRNKIFKEGNATEIKLFLQWADDFTDKQEIVHKGPAVESSPELIALAKEFESKLRDMITKKK